MVSYSGSYCDDDTWKVIFIMGGHLIWCSPLFLWRKDMNMLRKKALVKIITASAIMLIDFIGKKVEENL